MIQSNEFHSPIFDNITEGHLKDRKQELHKVLSHDKGLKDFLVDVVALANSARLRGKDSYLLYGVDNDRHIVGIEGQDIKDPPRDLAAKTTDADIEKHQGEFVGHRLLDIIKRHIGIFHARYEFGYVNDHLVSYLVFPGRTPEKWHSNLYQIDCDVIGPESKNILLRAGDCWTRRGESNDRVEEGDKTGLYCHEIMPFITTRQWLLYARNHGQENSTGLDEVLIPLYGEYSRASQSEQRVDEVMLQCINNQRKIVIVCNGPGSGKTTMLRQLTVRLAQDLEGASNVDQLRELDWYGEPQNPIPIYFSLAGYSHRICGDIKKCLCDQFRNSGGFDDFDVEKFTKLLLHRRLRFAIFLDSFEEMLRDNESGSLVALQSFCAEFSYRATIFIGCRSQLVSRVPGADQHDNIAILPIHERFIYEYLENLPFSSTNIVAEMIHLFQSKIGNDIYQLFARPRMIEALRSYLQHLATAQIQTQLEIEKQECRDGAKIETQDKPVNIILSHILEQTIEYFLRTEIRKRPPEGIENTDMLLEGIRQKLEHIAFQICINNKNPYIDFQRTYGETFIAWCIDADIIKIDRRDVKFTSLLTRDYLAAAWIFYQDLGETVAELPVRVSQFIAEISATDYKD